MHLPTILKTALALCSLAVTALPDQAAAQKASAQKAAAQRSADSRPAANDDSRDADLVVPTPPPDLSAALTREMLPPLPLRDPAVPSARSVLPIQHVEPLPAPRSILKKTPTEAQSQPAEGEYVRGEYVDGQFIEGEFVEGEFIVDGDPYEGAVLGERVLGDSVLGAIPAWEEAQVMGNTHGHPGRMCDARCRVHRYWGRVDYLYWSFAGAQAPPLVTTSPAGTARANAGILGLSTTTTLSGNADLGTGGASGGRVELGRWFPERGNLGWHIAYSGIGEVEDYHRYDSAVTDILARPFYSVEPGASGPNAELIAFPGQLDGNVSVHHTRSLEGFEWMFRKMLASGPRRRLQVMAGYQHNQLDDALSIRDFKRVIGGGGGLAVGSTLTEYDSFAADNRFHGAAIGVLASSRNRCWTIDMGMQLALGNTYTTVDVDGATTSSVPVAGGGTSTSTSTGGLLALGTNRGNYESDSLAMIPQLHVGVGYDLLPRLRLSVGYRFLYWSQVARAAEQIDSGLNLSQLDPAGLSGEPRPRFALRYADFWAQGINLGLDYRY